MKWKIDIYSLLEGFDWIALKKCLPQSILEEHWWGVFIVNASLQSLMFVHGIGISYLCCTVHVNICLWYRFKTILVPLRRHSHFGVWDFLNNDDTIENKFCWYERGSDWSFHIISSSSKYIIKPSFTLSIMVFKYRLCLKLSLLLVNSWCICILLLSL